MEKKPTLFAELLQDYMWTKRRPPITAAKLASELHIARQTVLNWIGGSKPAETMLPGVAKFLNVPLNDVRRIAGYSSDSDVMLINEAFEYITTKIEQYPGYTSAEKRKILKHLGELQAEYHSEHLLPSVNLK